MGDLVTGTVLGVAASRLANGAAFGAWVPGASLNPGPIALGGLLTVGAVASGALGVGGRLSLGLVLGCGLSTAADYFAWRKTLSNAVPAAIEAVRGWGVSMNRGIRGFFSGQSVDSVRQSDQTSWMDSLWGAPAQSVGRDPENWSLIPGPARVSMPDARRGDIYQSGAGF